jgi:hypothetical protein
VDYLTPISNCLYAKAKEILDPHFFTIEFGHFLDRIAHDVYAEKVTHQFDGQPDCNFELPTSAKLDELYNYPANDESSAYKGFEVSPYPSLVTANYLAAIGAVDTGVLMIEKWIKNFKLVHKNRALDYGPQLEWYLERAQLGAGNLPYQFGGLTVPHRGLVSWYVDETSRLRKLTLRIGSDYAATVSRVRCTGMLAVGLHSYTLQNVSISLRI